MAIKGMKNIKKVSWKDSNSIINQTQKLAKPTWFDPQVTMAKVGVRMRTWEKEAT